MTPVALLRRHVPQLRVRVTLAAALAALVVGAVGSVLFVQVLRENLEQALISSARQQADNVDAQLASGSTPEQAVVSGLQDLVIQIVDAQGRVVASDHPSVKAAIRTTAGTEEEVRVPPLDDRFAVLAQRADNGDLIVVGLSEEQVARATQTTSVLLLVSVPIGLVLLAFVVWLSVGRALRPVEAMRREAEDITSEHLHRRLPVPAGSDEIPRLASTLNEMLDRVDSSQQRQRQFVSDASHELRSPLATMRQLAEVAHRYPDRVASADLARDVLAEERRMEELVTALLTLARLDDRDGSGSTPVDLDDVVLQEVQRVRADAGPAIDASGVGAGQVSGSAVLLAQVVRNLLSNAVRHAGSRVSVALTEDAGRVRLVVDDDGHGVPADQREAVFERFVRLDESRARDAGGSGLGLAIVRKVVEGHGGTVTVTDAPGGGARFAVDLPAAEV